MSAVLVKLKRIQTENILCIAAKIFRLVEDKGKQRQPTAFHLADRISAAAMLAKEVKIFGIVLRCVWLKPHG